jgi:hypothetical protein
MPAWANSLELSGKNTANAKLKKVKLIAGQNNL